MREVIRRRNASEDSHVAARSFDVRHVTSSRLRPLVATSTATIARHNSFIPAHTCSSLEDDCCCTLTATQLEAHSRTRTEIPCAQLAMIDDGFPTVTSEEQQEVEQNVCHLYRALFKHMQKSVDTDAVKLRSKNHANFLTTAFRELPGMTGHTHLDA
jgi:hypothetical protein